MVLGLGGLEYVATHEPTYRNSVPRLGESQLPFPNTCFLLQQAFVLQIRRGREGRDQSMYRECPHAIFLSFQSTFCTFHLDISKLQRGKPN
jgi:hypothetical protein